MPTGVAMVELARRHIGEEYRNVLVPKNNANWRGPRGLRRVYVMARLSGGGHFVRVFRERRRPRVGRGLYGRLEDRLRQSRTEDSRGW
jgi:hypothetical protein